MAFLDVLPPVALAIVIFVLRIVDVSVGTVRTIAVIQGRARMAVVLGFLEVFVWVLVVAQVVTRLDTQPLLVPFYAGGYAAGVGVGMMIERRLSRGRYLVRIISNTRAREIREAIVDMGRVIGTFPGTTLSGDATLMFVSALGRNVPKLVAAAREADPDLIYTVEMALGWSENVHPPEWRLAQKRK